MRLNDNGVKLMLKIPVGKPDCNGVMYTSEAIEKALKNFEVAPILFRDDEKSDAIVIGSTTTVRPNVEWDEDGCTVAVNGNLYFAGADLIINDIKDGVVTDFDIVGFGISR